MFADAFNVQLTYFGMDVDLLDDHLDILLKTPPQAQG